MKKTNVFLLLAIILTSVIFCIQESHATLVTYDDFSSGDIIDPSKWYVDDRDSILSIYSVDTGNVAPTNVLHTSGEGNTSSSSARLFATQHLPSQFDGANINFFNFNLPGYISFIMQDEQNSFQISVRKSRDDQGIAYQHLDMFHSYYLKGADSWSGDLLYTSDIISPAEGDLLIGQDGVLAIEKDKDGGLYLNYSNTGYIGEDIQWTKKHNFGNFTFASNPFLEIFVSADDGSSLDVGGLYLRSNNSVPEPTTMLLLGLGLMGLAGASRKFKK
jgi:hypothetical protein